MQTCILKAFSNIFHSTIGLSKARLGTSISVKSSIQGSAELKLDIFCFVASNKFTSQMLIIIHLTQTAGSNHFTAGYKPYS